MLLPVTIFHSIKPSVGGAEDYWNAFVKGLKRMWLTDVGCNKSIMSRRLLLTPYTVAVWSHNTHLIKQKSIWNIRWFPRWPKTIIGQWIVFITIIFNCLVRNSINCYINVWKLKTIWSISCDNHLKKPLTSIHNDDLTQITLTLAYSWSTIVAKLSCFFPCI